MTGGVEDRMGAEVGLSCVQVVPRFGLGRIDRARPRLCGDGEETSAAGLLVGGAVSTAVE